MLFSPYRLALARYAYIRAVAYEIVRDEAVDCGLAGPSLRLTDIDVHALEVWRSTWHGRHPSGDGGWDWERISRPLRRRPSAFHVAVWSGERLCGLAVGRPSARRAGGVRHTLSIHYMEAAPDQGHPLRRRVALLVTAAAEVYGRGLGASRVRLIDPVPGALRLYIGLGFAVARFRGGPVYCEREIER